MNVTFAIMAILAATVAPTGFASVTVSVAPRGDSLRFIVVEATRDAARGRPATRRYEFTTPMDAVIPADQIRDYSARYRGADGIWNTQREPVAGYIIVSHFRHPTTVEFRLLERWDSHIVPMAINGKHRVRPIQK
jgi:hypothetical protein